MKAAVFYGKNDMRVEEAEIRKPGDNEVMIKIEACGVCGTDLHIYSGAEGAAKTMPPTILGHEFSGVVCETGAGVKSVKAGDRVCVDPNDACGECYYCRTGRAHFCENMIGIGTTTYGGFAEYCTVKEKQVYRISDGMSFEEGAMAEPVACCLHGIDLINVHAGQTIMVIGGGTIGMIMLQLAKLSGASTLIQLEPVKAKRELGIQLGADISIDPVNSDAEAVIASAGIKNIDTVIECVGLRNTMLDTVKYVGKGGTAMLFGLTDPEQEIPLKPFEVFKKEITIKASFINPYTHARAVSLLEAHKIDVKSLITDTVRLDDINNVFAAGRYKGRGKIIVKP